MGNLLEVFVVFIRDEVVYPNMGEKQGKRFLPLILTFFFFIVMLNLLGLIPGSATATASFSVTVAFSLITFFTYIIFGNKDFWKHVFAAPGVPFWLLPIMIPVELIGLLTKPFALSVRLLANMNAGHIIILAFLGIIINMKSGWVALGSVPMALAINMLEIFVAFLQGYIFSLLSSIFIGMAVLEHEEH
jgi:F-type H+-transporting ATPase subunit a